jgi:hypothetical protein
MPASAMMLSGTAASIPPSGATKWVFLPIVGQKYSDFGSTLQTSNGGIVEQYSDTSGSGHHAIWVGGSHTTLDTVNTYLGNATLALTGGQFLQIPSASGFSGTTGAMLYIVLKATADNPGARKAACKFLNASGGGTFNSGVGLVYPNASGNVDARLGGDALNTFTPGISISGAFRVVTIAAKTNFCEVKHNGVLKYSDASHVWNDDGSVNRLGIDEVAGGFDGNVACVILYNGIPNPTEQAVTDAYISTGTGSPF